jgi:Protein of unknown function (DUF5132)
MSHEQEAESAPSGNSQKAPPAASGGVKSAYLWGAASGIALAVFAPLLRPAAKSVVKGGIMVGRYATKVGTSLKEEFEDIAAEAQADLNREKPGEKPIRES